MALLFILTGSFAAVGTRKLGFFILDHRSALRIACHQVLIGFFDQLGRILHLDPRFRFLDQRLRLCLTFLIAQFLAAQFGVIGVLLLV